MASPQPFHSEDALDLAKPVEEHDFIPGSVESDPPASKSDQAFRLGPPNVPAFSCGRQMERSDRQARLLQRLVG